jgi:hypothetical protein
MIMIPILILQIFLFPVVAGYLMNVWVNSRRTLALQEAASNMGSTIQQMYFALAHPTVPAGTTSTQLGLPQFIDGYYYTANATLQSSGSTPSSSQVLKITLTLITTSIKATSQVILGAYAQWNATTVFVSNSMNQKAYAQKIGTTTIKLWFG